MKMFHLTFTNHDNFILQCISNVILTTFQTSLPKCHVLMYSLSLSFFKSGINSLVGQGIYVHALMKTYIQHQGWTLVYAMEFKWEWCVNKGSRYFCCKHLCHRHLCCKHFHCITNFLKVTFVIKGKITGWQSILTVWFQLVDSLTLFLHCHNTPIYILHRS